MTSFKSVLILLALSSVCLAVKFEQTCFNKPDEYLLSIAEKCFDEEHVQTGECGLSEFNMGNTLKEAKAWNNKYVIPEKSDEVYKFATDCLIEEEPTKYDVKCAVKLLFAHCFQKVQ